MGRIRINDLNRGEVKLTEEDLSRIQGGSFFDGRLLTARDLTNEQTYNRSSSFTYSLLSASVVKLD